MENNLNSQNNQIKNEISDVSKDEFIEEKISEQEMNNQTDASITPRFSEENNFDLKKSNVELREVLSKVL